MFIVVMLIVMLTPFLVGVFFVISCLYECTIGLTYEYGYNKNREDKKHWNIDCYEDYAILSGLTLVPSIIILLSIFALFWEHLVVTLPMLVAVFLVWAAIVHAVFYKIGCRDGQKRGGCIK